MDYNVGNGDVQHEMDDLVEGVRHAVDDAKRAHDHKEVLDLGQSLHMLEHKFAGLKAAISQEMGSRATPVRQHTEESKQMVEAASKLLDEMAGYRSDMEKLLGHMREIEDNINAAKAGMADFDKTVDDLSRLVQSAHIAHDELQEQHQESHAHVDEVAHAWALASGQKSGHHKWYMLILVLEVAGVAYWLYTKRGGMGTNKHLHKF